MNCRRRDFLRPLPGGLASRRSKGATFLLSMVVFLSGCASLAQAVKNQECALDPRNPYDVVEVDLRRHELRLFWKKPDGSLFRTLDAVREWADAQGDSLIAATNGGIYEPGFVPSGLYVEEGSVLQPLNLGDGEGNFYLKPNGVFLLADGKARIVEASQYAGVRGVVRYATQSGPMLLSSGRIHPEFNQSSDNCRLRSGIGVAGGDRVMLVISNGAVNFYDFARYFLDDLGATDALYLDGGISELYAPALGRTGPGEQEFAAILVVVERQTSASP